MSGDTAPYKIHLARVALWPITAALRLLPTAWADGLGRALGWGWYRLVPIRRDVARTNVRWALDASVESANKVAAADLANAGVAPPRRARGTPSSSRLGLVDLDSPHPYRHFRRCHLVGRPRDPRDNSTALSPPLGVGSPRRALGTPSSARLDRGRNDSRTCHADFASAPLGLQEAAGEPIVRGMYQHLGRCFIELLRFGGRPLREDLVRIEGREHIAGAGARGVLIVTAHLGNWELLVRVGLALDRPVSVVTRRLSSGWAEAVWRALRLGGPTLLPAGASARAAVAALRRGEIVGYVLDQHCPSPKAVRAPFFGLPASTSPDLARLARLTGAVVVPGFTWREGTRHVVRFEAPLPMQRTADRSADIEVNTRRCLAVVEQAIAAHPEQWLWIHRRWKPAPE